MTRTFTLLVPVYNEEATLEAIFEKIRAIPRVSQIVYVDDGSQDRSGEMIKAEVQKSGDRFDFVIHPQNRGKGAAIRSGLEKVKSDFAIIQDADMEYDPADLGKIMDILEEGEAQVVYGSRFLTQNPNLYRKYYWGNKLLTAMTNLFGRGHFTDSYTCYKSMSRPAWRALKLYSNGFEIEAEISAKCLKAGWSVKEVPISYNPRSFEAGKKIRPWDAVIGMWTIFKCSVSRFKPTI